MLDIEGLVSKWSSIGFLDDIRDNYKPVLALKYELTIMYIVNLHNTISHQRTLTLTEKHIETCVFPILYRIYKEGIIVDSIESFYNELKDFIYQRRDIFELIDLPTYDVEMDLCTLFSEYYVEKMREPIKPKKLIKRWRS